MSFVRTIIVLAITLCVTAHATQLQLGSLQEELAEQETTQAVLVNESGLSNHTDVDRLVRPGAGDHAHAALVENLQPPPTFQQNSALQVLQEQLIKNTEAIALTTLQKQIQRNTEAFQLINKLNATATLKCSFPLGGCNVHEDCCAIPPLPDGAPPSPARCCTPNNNGAGDFILCFFAPVWDEIVNLGGGLAQQLIQCCLEMWGGGPDLMLPGREIFAQLVSDLTIHIADAATLVEIAISDFALLTHEKSLLAGPANSDLTDDFLLNTLGSQGYCV
jgi:hypothetical protein